jgi:hypothetical protein
MYGGPLGLTISGATSGGIRVQAVSEVQSRSDRGWLIGFFQWLIWLFRRGGVALSTPPQDTPVRVPDVGSPDARPQATKARDQPSDVLNSSGSNSSRDATAGNQSSEPVKGSHPNDEEKGHGNSPEAPKDAGVKPQTIRAFLQRLPQIRRLLLEAETSDAVAEFMATRVPMLLEVRTKAEVVRADRHKIAEMGGPRAPERPKSRLLYALVMLMFIGVEAIINGSFLAVGSEGGLIAGWLMALGISLFNVLLLGFVFGAMALRQTNHRKVHRRLLGALALCAVLAAAYSSNLWVAHYRDALGAPDPDNASAVALAAWLANPVNPLKVGGVQSLWLLGLGIAFTMVGLIDGYRSDDWYPGYSRFYVEHIRRQEDFHALIQRCFGELREVKQRLCSRLGELADEIDDRLTDFKLLKARYASRPEDPDFDAWKQIEEGFPEARANAVLDELKEKRSKILDEYTSAMKELVALDPTTKS